ncbi:hypothetical protein C0993_003042 [Termitomyces sp. T159_Od127]|nr:hypothetical protein C0993_003042 [Termitomyces sp. T159_Od127]
MVSLSAFTPTYNPAIFPDASPAHSFSTQSSFAIMRVIKSSATTTSSPKLEDHHSSAHGQTPIVIFFEVFCGIIGVALLSVFVRGVMLYMKTPSPDRVSEIISRYRFHMEIEEDSRRGACRRDRYPVEDPVPPYIPRPPSYEEARRDADARTSPTDSIVQHEASPVYLVHSPLLQVGETTPTMFSAPIHTLPEEQQFGDVVKVTTLYT